MKDIPRCPFRVKALDHPDTCDPLCAWLMTDSDEPYMHACAVADIASSTGKQMNANDRNTWVITNEVD